MRKAARQIIKVHGEAGLSFRTLATKLDLSHSAPLHHFGTFAGLLGAVAAEAFDELAAELGKERESLAATREPLQRLAQRYALWALDNHRLYQAIHSPLLWSATTESRSRTTSTRQNPPKRSARDRARPWIREADIARDSAFEEFVLAAMDDLSLGKNKKANSDPVLVAQMVTILVDGYLFQFLNEYVRRDNPPRNEVKKLVSLALRGA